MENEYLNFVEERDNDIKKVVAARVSEDVLSSLNMAEEDSKKFGYSFSTTNIIEKALNRSLLEIKENSGIDYYELIKWQKGIKGAYKAFLGCIHIRYVTDVISFPEGYNPFPSYELKNIRQYKLKDPVDEYVDENYKTRVSRMLVRRMKYGRIECKATLESFRLVDVDSFPNDYDFFNFLCLFIQQHSEDRFIKIVLDERNIIAHGFDLDQVSAVKSFIVQFLRDHPQVLAFCSCPVKHGGTSAVFVHIKTNRDFKNLSSRAFLLNGLDSGENFESCLEKRERQIVEEWNQILASQHSTYQAEIRGDRIFFNDSRATDPETTSDE